MGNSTALLNQESIPTDRPGSGADPSIAAGTSLCVVGSCKSGAFDAILADWSLQICKYISLISRSALAWINGSSPKIDLGSGGDGGGASLSGVAVGLGVIVG